MFIVFEADSKDLFQLSVRVGGRALAFYSEHRTNKLDSEQDAYRKERANDESALQSDHHFDIPAQHYL